MKGRGLLRHIRADRGMTDHLNPVRIAIPLLTDLLRAYFFAGRLIPIVITAAMTENRIMILNVLI